ncbi:MAG: FGGY family carbohydrate kinase, partial [Acidimicrobiia bacterium]
MKPSFVGAVDQGTTSTRFIVFDANGRSVASAQEEHRQIFPQPGWVEHDPAEILEKTDRVISTALTEAGLSRSDLAAVGITNQRETTVLWERARRRPGHKP